ncbi:hypothetical protein KI387_001853, partial [Taxus chinensis]
TADEWRDLIRRVCTDTLMIPMERTRARRAVRGRWGAFRSRQTYRRLCSSLACGQDGIDPSHRANG